MLTLAQLLEKLPVFSEANARRENKPTDQQMIRVALQTAVIQLEKMIAHETMLSEIARFQPREKERVGLSSEAFKQR